MLAELLEREPRAGIICALLNDHGNLESALPDIAGHIRAISGCSAVGIKLSGESQGVVGVGLTEELTDAVENLEYHISGQPVDTFSDTISTPIAVSILPIPSSHAAGGRILLFGDREVDRDESGVVLDFIAGQIGLALDHSLELRRAHDAGVASQANEYRLRSLFETMGEGVALLEILPGDGYGRRNYRFVEANRAFEVLTGTTRNAVIGMDLGSLLKSNYPEIEGKLIRVAESGEEVRFTFRMEILGRWLSVVAYRPLEGQLAILFSDVTEKKKADEAILRLSMYDTLTEVYNRHFIEREMSRLEMSDVTPCGIILGDLNGLKLTNDALGHEAGDALLKRCAQTLVDVVDSRGTVGRWGGDEFIILVPNAGEDAVESLCETMRAHFSKDDTQLIPLSMALGWSCKTVSGRSLQPILRESENRMYHNKLMQGRGVRSAFISSLRRTLLEKAYETEEHSSRLSKLGVAMGKVIGLPQNQLDDLTLLCVLHDIGKIGIPDEILKKPGKLGDDEWEIMKRHSEVGYRIANASHELSHISYAILCHHERWDGTGYPLGLKASSIPLISRIVTIVDSFDAMTAGRAYCRAKTKEEGILELKRCAGTQFDPSLVDVAISIINGDKPERKRHAVAFI